MANEFPKAGEDGLISKEWLKDHWNEDCAIKLDDTDIELIYEDLVDYFKAQKALDDKWVLDRVVEITDQWDNKTPVTLYHLNITEEEYLKLKGGNSETG